MRAVLFLFSWVCWANILFSQTFVATPGPLLQQEIQFNQANECDIYFDNPGGDSLHLRWRMVESNLPEEWNADLCDYGHCYNGMPPNGLMSTVYDSIQPYLKLIVQPGNTAGATWIWYRVYEDGNPDNFVDVFFSLYTPGTLFTNAPEEIKLKAFPNPVVSDLFIENELALPLPSRMINSAGQLMWQGVVSASGSQQIIVSTWPAGVYFLHHENGTQKILIGQ
jgi:hypothetical protein